MLVVGLSQLYSHQYTFSSSGRPQLCNMCWLSACPSLTANPKFSHHPADLSFAIYVVCRPVPALQPPIHFLFVQSTPVVQYVLAVGLSQLYSHQQIFSSSGRPQLCKICWLSACPSFTAINTLSHHPANPSFAIYVVDCRPVPASQPSIHFLTIQPPQVCHVYCLSACPFLIIWLTLVLPCVLSAGLSQFYKHQQILL